MVKKSQLGFVQQRGNADGRDSKKEDSRQGSTEPPGSFTPFGTNHYASFSNNEGKLRMTKIVHREGVMKNPSSSLAYPANRRASANKAASDFHYVEATQNAPSPTAKRSSTAGSPKGPRVKVATAPSDMSVELQNAIIGHHHVQLDKEADEAAVREARQKVRDSVKRKLRAVKRTIALMGAIRRQTARNNARRMNVEEKKRIALLSQTERERIAALYSEAGLIDSITKAKQLLSQLGQTDLTDKQLADMFVDVGFVPDAADAATTPTDVLLQQTDEDGLEHSQKERIAVGVKAHLGSASGYTCALTLTQLLMFMNNRKRDFLAVANDAEPDVLETFVAMGGRVSKDGSVRSSVLRHAIAVFGLERNIEALIDVALAAKRAEHKKKIDAMTLEEAAAVGNDALAIDFEMNFQEFSEFFKLVKEHGSDAKALLRLANQQEAIDPLSPTCSGQGGSTNVDSGSFFPLDMSFASAGSNPKGFHPNPDLFTDPSMFTSSMNEDSAASAWFNDVGGPSIYADIDPYSSLDDAILGPVWKNPNEQEEDDLALAGREESGNDFMIQPPSPTRFHAAANFTAFGQEDAPVNNNSLDKTASGGNSIAPGTDSFDPPTITMTNPSFGPSIVADTADGKLSPRSELHLSPQPSPHVGQAATISPGRPEALRRQSLGYATGPRRSIQMAVHRMSVAGYVAQSQQERKLKRIVRDHRKRIANLYTNSTGFMADSNPQPMSLLEPMEESVEGENIQMHKKPSVMRDGSGEAGGKRSSLAAAAAATTATYKMTVNSGDDEDHDSCNPTPRSQASRNEDIVVTHQETAVARKQAMSTLQRNIAKLHKRYAAVRVVDHCNLDYTATGASDSEDSEERIEREKDEARQRQRRIGAPSLVARERAKLEKEIEEVVASRLFNERVERLQRQRRESVGKKSAALHAQARKKTVARGPACSVKSGANGHNMASAEEELVQDVAAANEQFYETNSDPRDIRASDQQQAPNVSPARAADTSDPATAAKLRKIEIRWEQRQWTRDQIRAVENQRVEAATGNALAHKSIDDPAIDGTAASPQKTDRSFAASATPDRTTADGNATESSWRSSLGVSPASTVGSPPHANSPVAVGRVRPSTAALRRNKLGESDSVTPTAGGKRAGTSLGDQKETSVSKGGGVLNVVVDSEYFRPFPITLTDVRSLPQLCAEVQRHLGASEGRPLPPSLPFIADVYFEHPKMAGEFLPPSSIEDLYEAAKINGTGGDEKLAGWSEHKKLKRGFVRVRPCLAGKKPKNQKQDPDSRHKSRGLFSLLLSDHVKLQKRNTRLLNKGEGVKKRKALHLP